MSRSADDVWQRCRHIIAEYVVVIILNTIRNVVVGTTENGRTETSDNSRASLEKRETFSYVNKAKVRAKENACTKRRQGGRRATGTGNEDAQQGRETKSRACVQRITDDDWIG